MTIILYYYQVNPFLLHACLKFVKVHSIFYSIEALANATYNVYLKFAD